MESDETTSEPSRFALQERAIEAQLAKSVWLWGRMVAWWRSIQKQKKQFGIKYMIISQKVCIVSHSLPPSPTGQSMVLYRLLFGQQKFNYCLVSTDCKQSLVDACDSTTLDAPYFRIEQVRGIPLIHRVGSETAKIFLDGLYRIYRYALQIRRIVAQQGCTAILACSGDPFDLPAAYLASRYAKVPLIPYMFDDYLYQWTGPYRTLSRLFAGRIMKSAEDVIVPNEHLKRDYDARYGIESTVIHNPCVIDDYGIPEPNAKNHRHTLDASHVNIVYTGSVYHAHYDAFRNMISAIEKSGRDDIRLHIFTAQSESQLALAGVAGSMVQVHQHIPPAEVPSILHQADILFLPLAFESPIPEVIMTSAPGKTGEYLAVGRPIIVHAPRNSFLADYFSSHGCGMVVDENDSTILSAALLKILGDQLLRDKLGVNARRQATTDFDLTKVRADFQAVVTKNKVVG